MELQFRGQNIDCRNTTRGNQGAQWWCLESEKLKNQKQPVIGKCSAWACIAESAEFWR